MKYYIDADRKYIFKGSSKDNCKIVHYFCESDRDDIGSWLDIALMDTATLHKITEEEAMLEML